MGQGSSVIWSDEITGDDISSASTYGVATGPINQTDRFLRPNISVGGISKSSGLTVSTADNGFEATAWGISSGGSWTSEVYYTDDYFEFSLTPTNGNTILFSEMKFTGDPSNTGPRNFELRASTDDFTNHIVLGSLIRNDDNEFTQAIGLTTGLPSPITTTIKFRIYGKGSSSSAGNFEIKRFEFSGSTTLPVVFSDVFATQKGNDILVNWKTLQEKNNHHFEIEISDNGTDFKPIKSVATKNGNADLPQLYSQRITANELASIMGFLILPVFLFASILKRNKWLGMGLVCLSIIVVINSCTKSNWELRANKNSDLFIRIKQVDVDGKNTYSKIVKVVKP